MSGPLTLPFACAHGPLPLPGGEGVRAAFPLSRRQSICRGPKWRGNDRHVTSPLGEGGARAHRAWEGEGQQWVRERPDA
jgi:hypothetical protein